MDKFKIFNKIKIDTDKYQEVETNNEELKTNMLSKINTSKRSMRKRKINNRLIEMVKDRQNYNVRINYENKICNYEFGKIISLMGKMT